MKGRDMAGKARTTQILTIAVAVMVLAVACDGAGTPATSTTGGTTTTTSGPTTTTSVPTTSTTQPGTDPCELTAGDEIEGTAVDLDGFAPDETVVLLQASDDAYDLTVCGDTGAISSLTVAGRDATVLGFVDLGDDGRLEILLADTTNEGPRLRAATLTIRGLAMTDLDLRREIDTTDEPPGVGFSATGFECRDVDDDHHPELLAVRYTPAAESSDEPRDTMVVHIEVASFRLDGTAATEYGVDVYETEAAAAYARWSAPDRCAPGSSPAVEIVEGANGWGRIEYDPADFASDGDVVIGGIARGGSGDRYVLAGAEFPSMIVGETFLPRPAIWSSADGLAWERTDLGDAEGELRDVAALPGGAGFVAVGRTAYRTAAVWRSVDGRTWELTEVAAARDGEGFEGPVMSAVAATPLGIYVVGFEDYEPTDGALGFDVDAGVWRSLDEGSTWERIEHPAFGSPGYQPNEGDEFNADLVGVAHHPDVGIVIVGSASDAEPEIDYPLQRPAVWVSSDGTDWARHEIDADVRLRGVTSTDDGLVTFGVSTLSGSPDADAVVLQSGDGVDWTPATGTSPGTGNVDGIQTILDAVDVPGVGVVAVGSDETDFEYAGAAAVWLRPDPEDAWERADHDDRVFGVRDAPPAPAMVDAVWTGEELAVAGRIGLTVELAGGGTACCVLAPALWLWSPTG